MDKVMKNHLSNGLLVFVFLAAASVVAMAGPGSISGTVRDGSGAPVPNAEVYALPVTTSAHRVIPFSQTDASGRFLLRQLAIGEYKVFAAKPSAEYPPTGFLAFYSNNQIQHQVVKITEEHLQADVTVDLGPRGGLVFGRFVDPKRSSPIYGHVTLSRVADPQKTLSTAFQEDYRFLIPADTDIEIEVTADGYEPWSYVRTYGQGLRIKPGKELHLDIALLPAAPK